MAHQGIAPVIFESVSNVTATNSVELGTQVLVDGRKYIYVYNAGATQISVGEGATINNTGTTAGFSVTVSSVTGTTLIADVFVGSCYHATITAGSYGWLLTNGYGKMKMVANSICTIGDLMYAGADGRWTNNILAGTGTCQQPNLGRCVVATGSGGIAEGYVKTLYG